MRARAGLSAIRTGRHEGCRSAEIRRDRTRRDGTSLLEVVIALVIGAFVLQLALATAAALARISQRLERGNDALNTLLIAEGALREEVRVGDALVWPDSIGVRAVRGMGLPCGSGASANEVVVAWRGARLPDPRKDSTEFVTTGGERSFGRLVRSTSVPGPCDLDPRFGSVRLLETEPAPPPRTVLVRIFESGSYHLSDEALRYRVGRGGRQPVTAPLFDPARSGFSSVPAGVRLDLAFAGEASAPIVLHFDAGDGPGRRP